MLPALYPMPAYAQLDAPGSDVPAGSLAIAAQAESFAASLSSALSLGPAVCHEQGTVAATATHSIVPEDSASEADSQSAVEAAEVARNPVKDFVGTWVYKGKYRYLISLTANMQLVFKETLTHGKILTGILCMDQTDGTDDSEFNPPPRIADKVGSAAAGGAWAQADLTNADGEARGCMRFCLTQEGDMRSNFKGIGKTEWSKDVIAKRASPMEWTQDSTLDDEWFEALDTVTVTSKPGVDSSAQSVVGTLPKGKQLQVYCIRAVCSRGLEYVELTRAELERCFEHVREDPEARGFVIVDATRLLIGMGLVLKGPLGETELSDVSTRSEWKISSTKAVEHDFDKEDVSGTQVLGMSRHAGTALLPILPEKVISVARNIVIDGWTHVRKLGVNRLILKKVQAEIMKLDKEMSDRQNNNLDYRYRTDRRLFFDTSEERLRPDIPGLNALVETLQLFVEQLGKPLQRSPLRMTLSGRCRPMLACYGHGDFYLPHVDNANGDGRVLTAVYYLNRDWDPERGGRLRLYPDSERRALCQGVPIENCIEIVPHEDSLAIFQADWMVHEVTAADLPRYALTLWFMGDYSTG